MASNKSNRQKNEDYELNRFQSFTGCTLHGGNFSFLIGKIPKTPSGTIMMDWSKTSRISEQIC